jgi:hypothetical protein
VKVRYDRNTMIIFIVKCDKLSRNVLRCYEFKSVTELRVVLLSITNVPTPKKHYQDDLYLLSEEIKRRSLNIVKVGYDRNTMIILYLFHLL